MFEAFGPPKQLGSRKTRVTPGLEAAHTWAPQVDPQFRSAKWTLNLISQDGPRVRFRKMGRKATKEDKANNAIKANKANKPKKETRHKATWKQRLSKQMGRRDERSS